MSLANVAHRALFPLSVHAMLEVSLHVHSTTYIKSDHILMEDCIHKQISVSYLIGAYYFIKDQYYKSVTQHFLYVNIIEVNLKYTERWDEVSLLQGYR